MPKIGAAPFVVAELFQNCSEFFPTAGSSEFRGWSVYNLQIALTQTGKAEFMIGHCRTSVAADSRLRNNRCHGRSSNFDCPNQQALRGFLVSASTRLAIVCVVSIAAAALAIALGSRYYIMRSVGLSEASRVAYPCLFSECRAVPRLPAEAAAERIPPQFAAVLADFRQRYPE